MRRPFLPAETKYSPDQPRDGGGRFASNGGGRNTGGRNGSGGARGLGNAAQAMSSGGVHQAAKILGAIIVVAGGINHFQAYVRRLQKLSNAGSIHEAIDLALSPIRRKSADAIAHGDLAAQLDHLDVLSEGEARHLLLQIIALMPDADAQHYLEALRREGFVL
jgi:hypothetical protein